MEALFALPQQRMDALTGWLAANPKPVSYTHLTLPTILRV